MKSKITVCICDPKTKTVLRQIDKEVPDIFNVFDVCELCDEQDKCKDCIVGTLQMQEFTIEEKG